MPRSRPFFYSGSPNARGSWNNFYLNAYWWRSIWSHGWDKLTKLIFFFTSDLLVWNFKNCINPTPALAIKTSHVARMVKSLQVKTVEKNGPRTVGLQKNIFSRKTAKNNVSIRRARFFHIICADLLHKVTTCSRIVCVPGVYPYIIYTDYHPIPAGNSTHSQ